ncbi:sensor histidine kinase [Plantactinospora siamensis]|uniref:histidine kinase n=1 Tax=Plantactinospora siamensis TaxID=555372 RepID=A0ABV6NUA3_9ACTN
MFATLRRRMGVRLRSALAAVVVVAAATLLAGAVLLTTARAILADNINNAATDKLGQVAAAVENGSDLTTFLRPSVRERAIVQVIDASDSVAVTSEPDAGREPISALRPRRGQHSQEVRRLPFAHDEPFRIVATAVNTPTGTRTVLVAESLESVDDSTEAILIALLLGLPMMALLVGTATFRLVGRTLRPVEAMRRRAASITSKNLDTRLPVPAADDEIAALASTMNTMLDRIESAATAQRRFVADASHELRSPLATVQASADLLDAAELPEVQARSVARIRREGDRIARLVEDLLLLARIDDHRLRIRHDDVDLDDLAYAERERITVEHPHLTIHASIDPVRVTGDTEALQRVLRNLVDNAARHATTTMSLAVRSSGDTAELAVGNDGPPIAAADRERIFDRFVRLDDSRSRRDGGTGLGLPIARDIIAAHGGTLTVDDLTDGATLRIRLPLPTTAPPPAHPAGAQNRPCRANPPPPSAASTSSDRVPRPASSP